MPPCLVHAKLGRPKSVPYRHLLRDSSTFAASAQLLGEYCGASLHELQPDMTHRLRSDGSLSLWRAAGNSHRVVRSARTGFKFVIAH